MKSLLLLLIPFIFNCNSENKEKSTSLLPSGKWRTLGDISAADFGLSIGVGSTLWFLEIKRDSFVLVEHYINDVIVPEDPCFLVSDTSTIVGTYRIDEKLKFITLSGNITSESIMGKKCQVESRETIISLFYVSNDSLIIMLPRKDLRNKAYYPFLFIKEKLN